MVIWNFWIMLKYKVREYWIILSNAFRNEGIWENNFQFSTVREQTDFRILLTSLVLSGNIGKHLLNMGELARYLQNKVYIFSSNFTNLIPWRTQFSVYELGYRKWSKILLCSVRAAIRFHFVFDFLFSSQLKFCITKWSVMLIWTLFDTNLESIKNWEDQRSLKRLHFNELNCSNLCSIHGKW